MDGSLGGGFSGHVQNCFDSSRPLQGPHIDSERRGDNRQENRHPGGRGRGTHPITPQAIAVNQGRFFRPSFPPAPYTVTNPVNDTDGFFHGTPQGALSNTFPPRHPLRNNHHPHTQSSPIGGHPAFNLGGSYNMEASRPGPFPLDVTQATQKGIGGSMAAVGSSIQPPALSPRAGSTDVFPTQRRQSLPCPVSGCPTSLSRIQDQRRHLLTHLPHWIHCPVSDCSWRGDRLNAFVRHWGNDHPSAGIQVPKEDHFKTYDPQPLMKAISEATLCVQDAQKHAISMVKQRALDLRKPELFENPWGSKWKKLKNSDPRHMLPTR
ncbi:hypothetical protein V8E52_005943 [Russula decolorans]